MPLDSDRLPDAYRQMHVIRKFEEAIRDLYQRGQIRGSFHPCVGQEGVAVGVCWPLRPTDYLTCTYRGHGHALAKGLSPRAAMAEMLGKVTGCSHGKGGSMHFTDAAHGLLGANAIVAAGVPHAAGAALAAKMRDTGQVAVTVFGEGAINQGVFHESLNLAVIWKLPLVLVCENNLYSEMTPSHETTTTTETYRRAAAYDLPAAQVDGNDVRALYAAVEAAVERARAGDGPTYLEARTYRLWGHMMGDPEIYRTKDEVTRARENEPIARLAQVLGDEGYGEAALAALEGEAEDLIADAVRFAQDSPLPAPADAFTEVFA